MGKNAEAMLPGRLGASSDEKSVQGQDLIKEKGAWHKAMHFGWAGRGSSFIIAI
jgi:hypothetical protein